MNMTLKNDVGTYPCHLCGQSYKHVGSRNRHKTMCLEKYDIRQMEKNIEELKTKLEEGLISAEEYEKSFEALNLKIKERKDKRKYQCIHCKKAFHVRYYCESHARHCAKNNDYITRRKNPELFLKFQCNICSVRFMSSYNFKKHEESCRRLMQYFSWENGRYICYTCLSQYQRTSKAWEHFRLCNTEKLKHKCSEEGCDFKYSQTKWWVRHMNSCHSSDINETKIFENMEGFLKWKAKEERKDFTFFKKIAVCKLGPDKTHMYYYCHFRGQQMNRKTKTSRRKSAPIIDYKCPARIKVIKTPNLITAAYVKSHSHPLTVENVKYQYWTPKTREKIKTMLSLGYTPQEIKESFKQYAGEVDGIPLKEHYITTRQISNFRYTLSRGNNVNAICRKAIPLSPKLKSGGCIESNKGEENGNIDKEDVSTMPNNSSLSGNSQSSEVKTAIEQEVLSYKDVWKGCEVVEGYSNGATGISQTLPMIKEDCSSFNREDCLLEDSVSFMENKKLLCRVLLKQLNELLNNKKINCFISQMYDSLKEITDMASLIVESNLIELVKNSSSLDGDSCTIEIVETGNSEPADCSIVSVETIQYSTDSSDLTKIHASSLDFSSEILSESRTCGIEDIVSNKNQGVIVVVNDNNSLVECDTSAYINKNYKQSSFHSVSNQENLDNPYLTVGPFKLNYLELKSLDMSISNDEINLLKSIREHYFGNGCLTDIVIDSFLYVLCLKKSNFEALDSCKARFINKGYSEGIEIFKNQTVFIPFSIGHHWVLFVVNVPNRKMYVFDSLNITFTDKHFEMAGSIMVFLNKKLNFDANMAWMVASPNRTTQIDSYDSGVYVCYYAVRLVKGLSLTHHCNTKEFRKLIYNSLVLMSNEYGGIVKVCV